MCYIQKNASLELNKKIIVNSREQRARESIKWYIFLILQYEYKNEIKKTFQYVREPALQKNYH